MKNRIWVVAVVVMVIGVIFVGMWQSNQSLTPKVYAQNCPARDFNIPWTDGEKWDFTGAPHFTIAGGGFETQFSGLDFSPQNSPNMYVRAVADGVVYHHDDYYNSYGYLYLDHDEDDWYSHYVHLDMTEAHIADGTHVNAGDIIGVAGDTAPPGVDMDLHLHIGFSCGGIEAANHPVRLEYEAITLEGWKPYNYTENDGVDHPVGHGPPVIEYDQPYYGFLRLSNQIKHACTSGCDIVRLRAGCGVVYPGYDSSHQQLFQDAFDVGGGEEVVGCSTNKTHWVGEGGDALVLQDFSGGTNGQSSIVHDEQASAPYAYVVHGDVLGEYFNTNNWWQKLGAPTGPEANFEQPFEFGTIYSKVTYALSVYGNHKAKYDAMGGPQGVLGFPTNNQDVAANSPQGTGGTWQQFDYGQIYHSDSFGTFETHGSIYNFYYGYEDGGTRSSLGFPKSDILTVSANQFGTSGEQQWFEGGDVYYSTHGTYPVKNDDSNHFYDKFAELGGVGGTLGFPKSGIYGYPLYPYIPVQDFEGGHIFCTPSCIFVPLGGTPNFTPEIEITEPYEGQLVSGQMGYVVDIQSPVDIERVVVYLYYKDTLNGGYHQESRTINAPMWGTRKDGQWKVDIDVFGDTNIPRAIAQNGAYVQAAAYDYQNNETIQDGVRTFPIYINQAPVFVDAKTGWENQLKDYSGNGLTIYKNSTVKVEYVSGTAYSAPGQPQVVYGDGGVCLNSDCLLENTSKGLVGRYVHFAVGSRKSYVYIGNNYESVALRDGYLQYGFNDDNSWSNNSGGWNIQVTIYPPGIQPNPTTNIQIREKGACNTGGCPTIELWVEGPNGERKKTGEWTIGTGGVWNTRNRNEPAYLWEGWEKVWIVYTNDSTVGGDRNYYLDWVTVDGVRIESDVAGSQYCRGKNYLPFQYNGCIPGQQNMVWSGASILPNPN